MLRPPLPSGLGLSGEALQHQESKATDWQFIYLDDVTKVADTDGYHDLTIHGGPVSFVFVSTVLENGEPVSLTASHELFEMVIDPIANMWAEATRGREFAYEMCDAVEEDTFLVDGLQMSNFVTRPGSSRSSTRAGPSTIISGC